MNDFSKRKWKWILIGWALLRLVFYFGAGDLWAAQTDRIERDLSQKKKDLKKIRATSKNVIPKAGIHKLLT